jgi:hypothetical protein
MAGGCEEGVSPLWALSLEHESEVRQRYSKGNHDRPGNGHIEVHVDASALLDLAASSPARGKINN